MPTRRDLLLGAVAGAGTLVLPGRAQAAEWNFQAAADYSRSSRGVSLLVMQAGKVLFEEYPNGGAADRAWELASGTKSFTGLMAAAAAADGLLRLDESCADTLTEWRMDGRRAITVRQVLSLTSGLRSEGVGRAPGYLQAVETPLASPPGARFAYGPGPFQVFGELLRRKLAAAGRPADPKAYLQARVLDAAGARPGSWRSGQDGQPLLPQGAAFSARNWARFGQYVLDGAPGVDSGVLAACFAGSKANPGYGLSWWLLRPGLIGPGPGAGVNASTTGGFEQEDIVMAAGAGNQRLYLLRKRGLVVVRQAGGILESLRGQGPTWSDAAFLSRLLG
ncbi:MAG: serine hydrolase [Hyphomonadaceae bacterium]|nr:serine hydrolase [Hyphomonadaceae bacterium]